MFVRAYSISEDRYYKSIVYGLFDIGIYEKAILIDPFSKSFVLVNRFNSTKELKKQYETINNDRSDWIGFEGSHMLKYATYCDRKDSHSFRNFYGYEDVFVNSDFMTRLLQYGSVPIAESGIKLRDHFDSDIWTYIRNQDDADEFMNLFVGFHDGVIEKIVYEEDTDVPFVSVIIDNTSWYGVAELCFEAPQTINIKPPSDNFMRDITCATLKIENETVIWADEIIGDNGECHDCSFIKALNLKWRKLS